MGQKTHITVFIFLILNIFLFQNCGDDLRASLARSGSDNRLEVESEVPQTSQEDGSNLEANADNTVLTPITPQGKIPILFHTQDNSYFSGESVTLSVHPFNEANLTYQWMKDGQPINNETSSTLMIDDVSANDAGAYTVIVRDSQGRESIRSMTVNIDSPPDNAIAPVFISAPQDQALPVGAARVLQVQFMGFPSPQIQWFFNDTPIDGADESFLIFSNPQTNQSGTYKVRLTQEGGAVVEQQFHLYFANPQDPPRFFQTQNNVASTVGADLRFDVKALSLSPMTYQWLLNGIAIANTDVESFPLLAVNLPLEGDYRVQATNTFGRVETQFTLSLNCPQNTTKDTNQNLCVASRV
ncbi:MAG: immunoglobulin domain-containing protein, partial [Pseudomonadota bacterium]